MRTRRWVSGLVILAVLALLGVWLRGSGRPQAPGPARAPRPTGATSLNRASTPPRPPALTEVGPGLKVTLHRSHPLTGRVLSGGAPVPDVEVRVRPDGDIPGVGALTATSDAEGRFSFVLPSDGKHTLSASHDGRYAVARVELSTSAQPDVLLELGSALHIEGLVSDDARRPVVGAHVALILNYRTVMETVTGAEGRYQLGPVEPGTWSFRVEADRYVDVQERVEDRLAQGTGRVDFTLARASSVTGRVTDSGGRPLQGLELNLVRPGPEDAPYASESQEKTRTDEDGRFVLDADAPGAYVIEVQDARFLDEAFPVQTPSEDVHLTMRPGASVKGTVVDARGLPLQHFKVALHDPELDDGANSRRAERTDAQGRFHLRGVKPGHYVLLASRETGGTIRRTWREVVLGEGVPPDVELRMEPERTLSGLVVDGEGRPIEGVLLRAEVPWQDSPYWKQEYRHHRHHTLPGTPTGPNGRFLLRHLTEATYDVSVRKKGYTLVPERSTGAPLVEERLFRVGADTGPLHLVLERKPHIIGRVVGPDGAPLSGFTVNRLHPAEPDGAFALPMNEDGPFLVFVSADGLATLARTVEPRTRGPDLDLGVLRMTPGRTVRGRVIDAETSEPVVRAFLELSTRDGMSYPEKVRFSAADGSFELHHVDTTSASLVVSSSDITDIYRAQRVPLDAASEELTVRLDGGAWVEVAVRDGQGRLRAASVHFQRDDGSSKDAKAPEGRLVQRGLLPGSYTVRLGFEEARSGIAPLYHPQRVVVPANGHIQVAFKEAEGGATVKLRVAGDTHATLVLVPGGMPPPRSIDDLSLWSVRGLISQQVAGESTFRHVPAGRATVVFVSRKDDTRFHLEELDVPAGGTLSRQLHPVWRPFEDTDAEQD